MKIENIPYITVADVAKKEGVTSKTVYEWIKSKVISPVYKYGIGTKVYAIGKKYKKV